LENPNPIKLLLYFEIATAKDLGRAMPIGKSLPCQYSKITWRLVAITEAPEISMDAHMMLWAVSLAKTPTASTASLKAFVSGAQDGSGMLT